MHRVWNMLHPTSKHSKAMHLIIIKGNACSHMRIASMCAAATIANADVKVNRKCRRIKH